MIKVGLFVGGRARRMGGIAKGLLPLRDADTGLPTTVLARTLALARPFAEDIVLVGHHAAYDELGVPAIIDARPDAGPLGGLVALLGHAGSGPVLALACDMPKLTPSLLARLVEHPSRAPVLAPRRDSRWEPLCARYDASPPTLEAAEARLARGDLSLQSLLDALAAEELPLSPDETMLLDDWDAPEDMR